MTRPRAADRERAAEIGLPKGAPPPPRRMWMNGDMVQGDGAALSAFDRGARDGEGLFETLRVEGGRAVDWERHLERMVLGAAELGFPVPPGPVVLRQAVASLLSAEGLEDAAVRITLTRGIPGGRPTRAGCWIDAEPLEGRIWRGARRGEARAIRSRRPFRPGSLARFKTTSRMAYNLAREEARAASADEVLLVSPEGELLEGATSNVFVVAGGCVHTPPVESGVLPGVVRGRTLAACARLGIPARVEPIAASLLAGAEEAFLTNAIQEVVPLVSVDGRPLPGTDLGRRLSEELRAGRGYTFG